MGLLRFENARDGFGQDENRSDNQNQAVTKVVTETLQARKRLVKDGPRDWSLAILVPTKRMTRVVSDAFREPLGNLPKIEHNAAVDMEAAILAAEIIAYILQSHGGRGDVGGLPLPPPLKLMPHFMEPVSTIDAGRHDDLMP